MDEHVDTYNLEVKNELLNFLTVSEAAVFLRVKVSTIYSWIHKQTIPYRKHGSRVIFYRDDLIAWSESKKISPKSFLGERRHRLRNIHR